MSNLNVRELDVPAHSRQFDANGGKIRYANNPLENHAKNQKKLMTHPKKNDELTRRQIDRPTGRQQ